MAQTLDIHVTVVAKDGGRRENLPGSYLAPAASIATTGESVNTFDRLSIAAGAAVKVWDYQTTSTGYAVLIAQASAPLDVVIVTGTPSTGSPTPANQSAQTIRIPANVPLVLAGDKGPTLDAATIAGVDGAGRPLCLDATVLEGRVYSVWVKNRGASPAVLSLWTRG